MSSDIRFVATEILEARKVVERLSETNPANDTERKRILTECEQWLAHAEEALAGDRGFLSYLKRSLGRFSALDAAYQRLNQVRHSLCAVLPLPELRTTLQKLQMDLPYIVNLKEFTATGQRLEHVDTLLAESPPLSTSKSGSVSEEWLRRELAVLSQSIAYRREQVWHKVNLLRTRLMTTLVVLVGLLIGAYFLVPLTTSMGLHWYHVCALQVFGAMGGALSAMLMLQPTDTEIAQYYVRLTSLYLRPAIGATTGFALGLLQYSGVVAIFPNVNASDKFLIALLVAFVGGFSERLFLTRLDVLESGKVAAKSEKVK